jgi:hypothetical protein
MYCCVLVLDFKQRYLVICTGFFDMGSMALIVGLSIPPEEEKKKKFSKIER